MDENNDIYLKINLFTLGNSYVGKTSFLFRYTQNIFKSDYSVTIGIDFFSKKITLSSGKKVYIDFYDTAGEEKYRSISLNLIKNADGIILMYAINDRVSFEAIPRWVDSIIEVKGNDFPIILIGNKCDLEEERKITKEEGEKEAEKYGFIFFESSNKDGTNLDEFVMSLVSNIIEKKKIKEKTEKQKFNLEKKKFKNKKKGFWC